MSCNVRNPTFGLVRPAMIQISLRIRAVRPQSSLGVFWIAKETELLHIVKIRLFKYIEDFTSKNWKFLEKKLLFFFFFFFFFFHISA